MLELYSKFKINKKNLNLSITNALLIISFSTLAMTDDTEQPVYIESSTQSFDMQKNIITITGNVVIKQGNIRINADKVIITCPNNKLGTEIIDGYGNPVTFYQMQDNNKSVQGHALQIHYELAKDLVVLTGNTYLEQLNSNITSDKIIYLIKEQKIQAYSEKGNYVTAVFIPSLLQDKNKVQALTEKKSS